MARHLLAVAAVALLAQRATGYPWPVCGESSSFNPNSTYQVNLNLVAATLPKNASISPNLFATAVIGAVPEQIWAMGLCRGDVNASNCFSCLTQAFHDLPNDCSYYKDATIYYDPCMLHYSDVHTLPSDDTGPTMDAAMIVERFRYPMQVWEHWTMGTVVEIMDSSLSSHSSADQMLKCIHIGLLCVQHNPADRPMMSTVNRMLSSSTVPLQAPSRPAFCFQKSGVSSDMYSVAYRGRAILQSTCISPVSENEVSIPELEAR